VSEQPKGDRSRAIGNTVMLSIFFVMAVLVTLTRSSWWGTLIMAAITLWALGALIANALAIKHGLPPAQEPPRPPQE
jgi:multidrug efflux pump subunit AcrB